MGAKIGLLMNFSTNMTQSVHYFLGQVGAKIGLFSTI